MQNQPSQGWLPWFADEHGATATEYGILMSFIVIVTMSGVTLFGLELLGWYDEITAHFKLMWGIA